MKIGDLDELVGKYCRVISKESDTDEAFYHFGTIRYINVEEGAILVDTKNGIKQFKINEIFDALPIEEYVTKKF